MNKIKISFCSIMLNNEPFTRYLLRQIYPFAHEIIVVEGAAPFSKHVAREDGHSSDGTLKELRRFKREEDPEDKLIIVTAEDEGHADGFWSGEKEEMCRAFAKRVTGAWLWHIDGDEFYTVKGIETVIRNLTGDKEIAGVSFPYRNFWGSPDYYCDGPFLRGASVGGACRRLFRWGAGYRYSEHRPIKVLDDSGRDLSSLAWVSHKEAGRWGVWMFHYSLVFPHKVLEKNQYYVNRKVPTRERDVEWGEQCWFKLGDPFHVHNVAEYPAWLERYDGEHPEQGVRLWQDLKSKKCKVQGERGEAGMDGQKHNNASFQHLAGQEVESEDIWESGALNFSPGTLNCLRSSPDGVALRDMSDVEALMRSWRFRFCRAILRMWPPEEWVKYRGGYRLHQMFYWMAGVFSRWLGAEPWVNREAMQ